MVGPPSEWSKDQEVRVAEDTRHAPKTGEVGPQSLPGCLVRLGWMGGGHVVLIILTLSILREDDWTLTLKDALFWLVVAAMIAVRHIDMVRFRGTTGDGEPTTLRHVKRYTIALLGLAGLMWAVAQSFHVR